MSKFKESEGLYVGPKEAGYCLLRSQLLMAFHDNPSFRHLANQVPVFLLHVCHVMSCHVMSCHVMSCHVMSCHSDVMKWWN